jgi:hypothetical protein
MNLSTFRQIDHIKDAFFLVVTFIILVFSNSPMVYGQNTYFSPFSLLDRNSINGSSDVEPLSPVDHNMQPSQENPPKFQPVFAPIDPESSASSNLSSIVKEQNETQQQISSSSSSPRHPREPLTQYQTIVQTPGRTLAVQPTTTLPPATLYPPGIGLSSTTGTGGTNIFPQTTLAGTGTLPQSAVTFPPSVFPPTTSFIPPTSIAPVTGPLSPWFPSIPAIACGGTFTFSVVGSLDRDNDNGNDNGNDDNKDNNNKNDKNDNNNDKDKLYAIQIQSNGGSSLDTDSIEGKVFAGEKNIERNNGEDFDVKDVFNDCQVVTFSN